MTTDLRNMIERFVAEEAAGGMKAVGPLLPSLLIKAINPLLEASGQNKITNLRDIEIRDDRVEFVFHNGYSSMYCGENLDSVVLPFSVIDALDPGHETTLWCMTRSIEQEEETLSTLLRETANCRSRLASFKEQLEALKQPS